MPSYRLSGGLHLHDTLEVEEKLRQLYLKLKTYMFDKLTVQMTRQLGTDELLVTINCSGDISCNFPLCIEDLIKAFEIYVITASTFTTVWEDIEDLFYVGTDIQIKTLLSTKAIQAIKYALEDVLAQDRDKVLKLLADK